MNLSPPSLLLLDLPIGGKEQDVLFLLAQRPPDAKQSRRRHWEIAASTSTLLQVDEDHSSSSRSSNELQLYRAMQLQQRSRKVVSMHTHDELLPREQLDKGGHPTHLDYLTALRLCNKTRSKSLALRVRDHVLQQGALSGYLGDYVVVTLAKCGAVDDAWETARKLPHRTVFSWTAIISAFFECGRDRDALQMHHYMQEEGIDPDSFTFVVLLKACGRMGDLVRGMHIHEDARKRGLASDAFVGNTLVSMYGKCGALVEAENVFVAMYCRDTVSWTAMLSAYVEQGQGENALRLYRQMQEEGMTPNQLTCVTVLQACVLLAEEEEALLVDGRSIKPMSLEIGCAVHAFAHERGMETDAFVGTTLVNMYGKCGAIDKAEVTFDLLSQKNIVSWNAMISAYVDQNDGDKALLLYWKMLDEGVTPDLLTFLIALQACASLAEMEKSILINGEPSKLMSLSIGEALHLDACLNDFILYPFIGTTLVSMYGKCGAIKEAEDVFRSMSQCDTVSWTAMFSVYIEQREGKKALELYRQMKEQQVNLDDVTLMLSWTAILSGLLEQGQADKAIQMYGEMQEEEVPLDDVAVNCVLQACGRVGNLELCSQVHFSIICSGYDQMHSTAASLIHAYADCGSMKDAQVIFNGVSEPDIVSWTAYSAGHAGEGNAVACLQMFEMVTWAGLVPDEVTFSAVLSACCHAGLVAEGLEYFQSMSRDYHITPDLKHYSIMLDLLGRAGNFTLIETLLGSLPVQADIALWLCLLGACRQHGNVKLGKRAFDHALHLQPKQAAAYILMSNIYAEAGLQDYAAKVEISRQKAGALVESWDFD